MKNKETVTSRSYPIGISDFKEIVIGNYTLIDKSIFIKEIMDDAAKVILITRPRRFGKTLNMSMLRYFFNVVDAAENRLLFVNKAIASAKTKDGNDCLDLQGKHPVIFLSLKGIKASEYELAYKYIANVVQELYADHRYLLNGATLFKEERDIYEQILNNCADVVMISNSLKNLAKYLARHYNTKSIILIDEYDTPIHSAYLANPQDHIKMLEFMRRFFGEALKDNEFLHKAVITGILRIAQANLFSDLNNLDVYTMLREEYKQYFGFTTGEVNNLVANANISVPLKDIQAWYNGYKIADTVLYNPWSILCCLKNKGHLQSYWLETGEAGLLGVALRKQGLSVKLQMQQLMEGETIQANLDFRTVLIDLERSPVAVWTLLVFSGYLNAQPIHFHDDGKITCLISIPNREVSGAYARFVENWYQEALTDGDYMELLAALTNGRVEQFQELLQEYIEQSLSYFDLGKKTPEKVYHVFMLGLLAGLRNSYIIQSNKEAGFGRFDLVLIPREPTQLGILIEFKSIEDDSTLDQTAVAALMQIKLHHYMQVLEQHGVKKHLAIGIAFSGKRIGLQAQRCN